MTLISQTGAMTKQFTVSGYVLDETRERLLLVSHKKLGKWLPPGGHVDQNETPQAAVVREVFEETGIVARLVPHLGMHLDLDGIGADQLDTPVSMSYQLIPERPDEPAHIHMDMAFILIEEASTRRSIDAELQEVNAAGWFSLLEIERLDAFASVKAHARAFLDPSASGIDAPLAR